MSALATDDAIALRGHGMVTPLGQDSETTWQALMAGRFIREHSRVPLDPPGEGSRVARLALMAAREAIANAGWTPADLRDDSTALLVGTSKGPVESWLQTGLVSSGIEEIAASLGRQLGMGYGPRLTVSAACSSGLHAMIHAAMLIRSRQAARAIVVAAESSLHPMFIGSFKRLGVLAGGPDGCRPFDQHRDGFLMSEAAAAVCLERSSATDPTSSDHSQQIILDGFAMGGDATHLTRPDADGATLRHLLRQVLADRPVDLLHAHATGTVLNDPVELAAVDAVLGSDQTARPVIYSHKGALGHSLGAAGLVSVVIDCICHGRGVIPGNVQTHDPLPVKSADICKEPIKRTVRRSMAWAAGFGGPTAAIALRTIG